MSIDELFATAVVDELTGDAKEYKAKLEVIAQVAELLGIETDITIVTLNLREDATPTDDSNESAESATDDATAK